MAVRETEYDFLWDADVCLKDQTKYTPYFVWFVERSERKR